MCGLLILMVSWGCGDDSTGPFEGDPYVISWQSQEAGRASLIYGESNALPNRVAYEIVTEPGSTHSLRLLGVEAGKTYQGRWRLHEDDGPVLEEDPFIFRVDRTTPLPPLFSFTMIDVGWGDAHLIRTRDGSRILVDAGRPDHAVDVVRFLRDRGIDDETSPLTGIVLSHPDCDHVGGFVGSLADSTDGVLENFHVEWALESDGAAGSDTLYGRYRELLARQGAVVREAPDGAGSDTEPSLQWGNELMVRVFNSGNNVGDQIPNNASLVLNLRMGGVSILTGGDALIPLERRMLEVYGNDLRSHILKVHHHGNSDASLGEFLEAVKPMAALVPIARQEVLIMPSAEVLQRLRDVGADVLRSDQIEPLGLEGGFHVTVWTDGAALEVSWEASQTPHEEGQFDCDPTRLGEGEALFLRRAMEKATR
jgi:beta-lactamase superfamily II metal-dependent hydrolase